MTTHHASGHWHVAADVDEFVDRWGELLTWTKDNHPGLEQAVLIRSTDDPNRFVSLATWSSPDARADWKSSDGFRKRFMACRELCDEFVGGDYESAISV